MPELAEVETPKTAGFVHYAKKGVHADLIKLYGSMELAPLMGLADEIVDIVDTAYMGCSLTVFWKLVWLCATPYLEYTAYLQVWGPPASQLHILIHLRVYHFLLPIER